MNQILLTNDYNNRNNKKNDVKNNKNYDRNNSKDIKKIIIFFAVVILIFGVAIGILYGYKLYKNNKEQTKTLNKPEIALESTETEVTINAKAEAGINKIIYQWNEEEENVRELGGRTKQEEKIDIPNGDNTLKVKVIDQAGQEIETTESFSRRGLAQDNYEGIEINLTTIDNENGNGKIEIEITSEQPIKYVTYKRNDEEEKTNEPEEEKTYLKIDIDAKKENNNMDIYVEDVDGNSNQHKENIFVVTRPQFDVYREGDKLFMKITHDRGFKKIDFNINGIEITYDETKEDYDANKTEVEYYFNLQEGENFVTITAYSEYLEIKDENKRMVSATYEGRCNL